MKWKPQRTSWLLWALLIWLAYTGVAQAFYDPNLGRWVNRDPIGEGEGINLYAPVRNNPIHLRDPDGLDAGGRVGPGFPDDGYHGAPPNPPPPTPPPKPPPGKLPDADSRWPSAANAIDCIPSDTGPKKRTVPGAGTIGKAFLATQAKKACYNCCESKYGLTTEIEDPAANKNCKADCDARYKEIRVFK